MTSMDVVIRVLIVEGVLITLALLAVFGHAFSYRRSSARRVVLLDAGRDAMIAFLAAGDVHAELGVLRTLPRRALIRLLADIAPSLVGPHKEAIYVLAERLRLTDFALRSLESPFWWQRLQGARLLTLAGRDVHTMSRLERDPHPLVRAQLAEALGQHASEAGANTLIRMLADTDAGACFAAKDSLMRLGTIAQNPIAASLAEGNPKSTAALLDVAAAVSSGVFLPAALAHSTNESADIRMRAARVLAAIGAGAALDRLVEMLSDTAAAVRAVAATAIGTLGHWPAAAALARLVGDAEWDVRMAASVALQRLGAPGELLLRRARDRNDGPGAEVARQILDVAERLRPAQPS